MDDHDFVLKFMVTWGSPMTSETDEDSSPWSAGSQFGSRTTSWTQDTGTSSANTPAIPHTGQVLPAKVLHFFWIKRQIQIPKEFWFQAPSEVALFLCFSKTWSCSSPTSTSLTQFQYQETTIDHVPMFQIAPYSCLVTKFSSAFNPFRVVSCSYGISNLHILHMFVVFIPVQSISGCKLPKKTRPQFQRVCN